MTRTRTRHDADAAQAVALLEASPLFAGLSRRATEKVARCLHLVEHRAGKDVAVEGQGGVALHLIRSGTAEVLHGGEVVQVLGPGDHFGEQALLDHGPRTATVRAVTDLQTYALVDWEFQPLLREEPALARALLATVSQRLRQAQGD